ncbi:hypothetical protein VTJ04DRAFT_10148 [Mycothermus thermophilus]|uniref:uncharacterized protein n=1 Tax=Humicola insolens TaxID=85995 RepID=UPI003744488F
MRAYSVWRVLSDRDGEDEGPRKPTAVSGQPFQLFRAPSRLFRAPALSFWPGVFGGSLVRPREARLIRSPARWQSRILSCSATGTGFLLRSIYTSPPFLSIPRRTWWFLPIRPYHNLAVLWSLLRSPVAWTYRNHRHRPQFQRSLNLPIT